MIIDYAFSQVVYYAPFAHSLRTKMDALCFNAGIHGMPKPAELRSASLEKPSVSGTPPPLPRNFPWGFTFRHSLSSWWPGGKNWRNEQAITVEDAVLVEEFAEAEDEGQSGNWVFNILNVKTLWKDEFKDADHQLEEKSDDGDEKDGDEEGCDVSSVDDIDCTKFDRESFSELLRKVPLREARFYAWMSYLGNLAYSISQIKPGDLLRSHGLRFVTSSLEKKEQAVKAEEENNPQKEDRRCQDGGGNETGRANRISASSAYQIAASAASYLHSHTKSILHFKSTNCNPTQGFPEDETGDVEDMAALMATTDSVTAVVAAKEEIKQAVADDLNSTSSSPCEWFVCDDDQKATRFFVIQGSESLASWKANLLFEPVQFEGLDVLVHRGIYEAAKGIYDQMLPDIKAHMESRGECATFRFTGHSLGGSLALLINLMLLIRGVAPRSSLLPVITFGAPTIMCGGDHLLHNLGLPRNHVQSISMHRDIVPRAFSCNYPSRVVQFLKAVNRNFRNHPCLSEQKLLYAPMGEFFILQPDDTFSPNHELLPSGSGLYLLTADAAEAEKQVRAAQLVFLNSPHPLEILSDRCAYGSDGTIFRDHDMNSYLKSFRNVVCEELNRIRKCDSSEQIVAAGENGVSRPVRSELIKFSWLVQNSKASLKRFGSVVASQHMHLLVVLLLPAKLLVLATHFLPNTLRYM
ncbi:phospholipase A1 PLIP2, chloroplastic-like [Henckelia pumila]|uniref:phospholipase A1 PLIP2, chloroplastic-like n=1 Tax=Henckelia pumila TaxID=405737 RepID=UPI003C6EA412